MGDCGEQIQDEESNVTSCCCKLLLDVGDKHEPPIGFGEGSSFIDLPNELKLSSKTNEGDGYNTYHFTRDSGEDYTNIGKITVLTEGGRENPESRLRGGVSFCTYEFAAPNDIKLRLWLSYVKQPPFDEDPDVIINGSAGGWIKTKEELGGALSSEKKKRTFRHRYPDPAFTPIPGFRHCFCVVKWDVWDGNSPVKFDGSSLGGAKDDFYYFYITFNHVHLDDHK